MPPSAVLTTVLVAGMIVTGVSNTLLSKYQDMQCVRNCDDPDPAKRHVFEQPVMQTLQMFIGEMGCWLIVGCFSLREAFRSRRRASLGYEPVGAAEDDDSADPTKPGQDEDGRTPIAGWNTLLLAIPACCDIAGTTLMNVGLLFTVASIFQMTRGALVLFVGLFSVIFLKRHLAAFQWFALVTVVSGVAVVGLSGALFKEADPAESIKAASAITASGVKDMSPALRTTIGVLLIAFAQMFTATQFVVEEWILEKYALAPLKVVGWEGVFGFLVTLVGMVVLHFTVGVTEAGKYGYFDAEEGLREVLSYRAIGLTSIAIMASIGGFNFFGISVTRSISATARSVIDTSRTLFIWMVSLGLRWETFKPTQLVGFAMLVYGTFLFNGLISYTICGKRREPTPAEDEAEAHEPGVLEGGAGRISPM